jgi:hypothetical protein
MQDKNQQQQPPPPEPPEITPKAEALIKRIMEGNPEITREEVIDYLISAGGL